MLKHTTERMHVRTVQTKNLYVRGGLPLEISLTKDEEQMSPSVPLYNIHAHIFSHFIPAHARYNYSVVCDAYVRTGILFRPAN